MTREQKDIAEDGPVALSSISFVRSGPETLQIGPPSLKNVSPLGTYYRC